MKLKMIDTRIFDTLNRISTKIKNIRWYNKFTNDLRTQTDTAPRKYRNIGPMLRFLSECHLVTWPNFLSELLCCDQSAKVALLDYVTPIFYQTEVGAHDPIFIAEKGPIKLAHTIQSSLRFFIYDKNLVHV